MAEDAERELPREVGGVEDAGVEPEGAEDAVNVTIPHVSQRQRIPEGRDLRGISTDMNALVGRRKRAGYALVDFTLVSLRLQSPSLNVELTSPHSKPAHCACKLDCPRCHDLIQLFENLISRDAVVINARCTNITGVSATASRCGELAGFFACDLGVESIQKVR